MGDHLSSSINGTWTGGNKAHAGDAGSVISVGRDPTSEFNITDTSVSWNHAELRLGSSGIWVTDLDSTNGTFVDGVRLTTQQSKFVGQNQRLRFGSVDFEWSTLDEPNVEARCHEWLIGRAPNCDISIADPAVSSKHAILSLSRDGWAIQDLGSTNGTFVNGRRISHQHLQPSDQLRIGSRLLDFTAQIPRASADDGVQLTATHLTLSGFAAGRVLTLLRDVSLTINPRELVAIIGASGAGKTTLMLALAGQQPSTAGAVRFNDIDLYANPDLCRSSIGFVPQSDIVHQELTVESALRYSGKLRLPADTSESELQDLVHYVLRELGLWDHRHKRIRTLSGGERKRVNIGVELLTKPSILFLDEPTSGLDAALERRVVSLLRGLASDGRTVITVTHSVQTIEDFDKIVVMSPGGRLAFYGSPGEALKFFDARDFVELYEKSNDPVWSALLNEDKLSETPIPSSRVVGDKRIQAPQFWTLVARYIEILRSDPKNLLVLTLQAPLLAIFVCLLYNSSLFASHQEADRTGHFPIQDAPAMLFLLAFGVGCFGLFNSVKEIVKERAIYDRERHVFLRRGAYLLSKLAVIGAVAVLQCLVIAGLVGLLIGFGVDASGTLSVLMLLILGMLNAVLVGLLISAAASNADQAITLAAGVLLAEVAFSGLIPLERMGSFLAVLGHLSGMRWTYGGLCSESGLEKRWQDIGLGDQVPQIFSTSPSTAMIVLITLAMCLFGGTWFVMAKLDAGKGPFRR